MRLYALLETMRESEDKKGDPPGRRNSKSKGVAGAGSIQSICGSMGLERDQKEEQMRRARVSVLGFYLGGSRGSQSR